MVIGPPDRARDGHRLRQPEWWLDYAADLGPEGQGSEPATVPAHAWPIIVADPIPS